MHIDSVTVLPDDNTTTEHIYSADAENLNEVIFVVRIFPFWLLDMVFVLHRNCTHH